MLSKEEFISLLKAPERVDKVVIPELNGIIDQYPYFLSAKLLKVKGLKNSDSLEYEDFLRKTAAYTSNREILYHLLMKDNLQSKIEVIDEETNKNIIEPDIEQEKEIEIQNSTKEKKQTNLASLEQQVLEEAVTASLAYELDPELTAEESSLNVINKNIESEYETKEIDLTQKTSFSSWLKQINASKNKVSSSKKDISAESIIDRFIKTEPRIGDSKKEFFTPENMARMSLVEDADFVTETLAKIYAKQGNLNKAISAFNKLSLKYPEKSTYFAAQIKNLEEQLKQK